MHTGSTQDNEEPFDQGSGEEAGMTMASYQVSRGGQPQLSRVRLHTCLTACYIIAARPKREQSGPGWGQSTSMAVPTRGASSLGVHMGVG